MSAVGKDIFIVAAKRTAFGTFGGSLKHLSAVQLGAEAAKGAIAQLPSADIIDTVHIGNVQQTTTDVAYLARHVALKAGVKTEAPALTVNRLCGSGFQSIVSGVQDILVGDAGVVLTGGAESMSQAPYLVHGVRFGSPLGVNPPMVDSLWEGLQDKHVGCPMAITAENLAEKYGITKEEADKFALRSQQKWAAANEAGLFKDEIVPIKIKDRKKGEIDFDTDEHPRPQSTIESLSKLKPLFKKDGTVSAGNASGISDGAGAVVIASADAVKKHNLKPMARIVSYAIAGVPPEIMGIGPVPAIQEALRRANLTIDDMDFLEINEAFASQFLACQKDLGFDLDREGIQSKGGAIAQGHPTGASGARIMGSLAYELARNPSKKYAIGSACIGGGQGIAIILENVA
mmetsp:Transcript_4092/g.8831  ORF Transcript_4092/g.8831 Transcript_4092/m.8831 type:complete len:402 (-) Transcript_4092:78-1283(-)|eukprot:CAMPEP_0171498426 /NCGR_PEP_ID=MMETSP0958-20121227/7844_1 /TAXON_ID=87120 /ORGANISM="Aurantiochytrium limacinum, Strain ATCCMYA-1381" /LENGTH=401 /DNA_ID=CAMNT_0012032825 /DNA_START=96 /DNA_END=1301 /DNA_ORIENTATION=+